MQQPIPPSDQGDIAGKLVNTTPIDYLSVLEDVLRVLGVDNMSILYHHLEKLGVRKEEIADKPVEFSKALRVIFGQGASILERQIVSSLASKTGHAYSSNVTLADVLKRLKQGSAAN